MGRIGAVVVLVAVVDAVAVGVGLARVRAERDLLAVAEAVVVDVVGVRDRVLGVGTPSWSVCLAGAGARRRRWPGRSRCWAIWQTTRSVPFASGVARLQTPDWPAPPRAWPTMNEDRAMYSAQQLT